MNAEVGGEGKVRGKDSVGGLSRFGKVLMGKRRELPLPKKIES